MVYDRPSFEFVGESHHYPITAEDRVKEFLYLPDTYENRFRYGIIDIQTDNDNNRIFMVDMNKGSFAPIDGYLQSKIEYVTASGDYDILSEYKQSDSYVSVTSVSPIISNLQTQTFTSCYLITDEEAMRERDDYPENCLISILNSKRSYTYRNGKFYLIGSLDIVEDDKEKFYPLRPRRGKGNIINTNKELYAKVLRCDSCGAELDFKDMIDHKIKCKSCGCTNLIFVK